MRIVLFALLVGCGSSSTITADAPPGGEMPDGPSPPCGDRTGMRGKTNRTVMIDGLKRTYIVYVPTAGDAKKAMPLVFVHHGYTMSGQNMFDITEYTALADAEGIALAFPDGQGGPSVAQPPWNVGTNVCPVYLGTPPNAPGDDFKFLDTMKADIAQDQCIDEKHVFVTGFSMGGYFSHHAGCMRTDLAAVAPHSGGTHPLDNCASPKKPIIIFHGDSDGVVPPGCNDPNAPPRANVVPAATAWATHNGCDLTTQTITVTGGTCRVYDNCPKGGQVELCTFPGMAHCWAGGPSPATIFNCPTYADATMIEWQFFKQYAWDVSG